MSEARDFLAGLLERLDSAAGEPSRSRPTPQATPHATPPHEPRRLCVGMATFDDFDGVWFTIQAVRMFHRELADRLSFLIVDNHPMGPDAAALAALAEEAPFLRYVPFGGYQATAVRDLVFRESNSEIVCCLDSHVLLAPGALAAIDTYFAQRPDSEDLIQGPMLDESLAAPAATHFAPTWGSGMHGQWALDERILDPDAEPFEIEMQGLGVFACRREAWPGLNPRFRGFGGEEGYLHEKVRRRGGRVICHPAVGWAHRFARPGGPTYRLSWHDRLRNYLIGWDELGWDTAEVIEHFREQFEEIGAPGRFGPTLERARYEAGNPFSFFDGIFCLSLDRQPGRWAAASSRHEQLGFGWQVERFPAVDTPENHHRGHALSFRAMVEQARHRGLKHMLILEDDAVFLDCTSAVMEAAVCELPSHDWDLCFLGACVWSQEFPFLPGSRVLQRCGPVTCTHAVAIHRRAYDRILADIPAEPAAFDAWLANYVASDQYLYRRIEDGTLAAVILSPRIATQPALLDHADGDLELADRYVI